MSLYVVHLKFMQCCTSNDTLIKLEEKKIKHVEINQHV